MDCPCCGSADHRVFYEIPDAPVHSVLLMPTREEALDYPRGAIALHHCRACGFVFNASFDPGLHHYSRRYEETQGFSATFNAFHRGLAERLIERHNLRGKRVLEIGCGKGEFLALLCEMGGNSGIGFDPAFVDERRPGSPASAIEFVPEFFNGRHSSVNADFIACKMTLEHIHEPVPLLEAVRDCAEHRPGAVVFFQVPDAMYVLGECAFWDVYYEHCSYFTAGSLARLFERCGFEVLSVSREYSGQYITLEARVGSRVPADDDRPRIAEAVERFAAEVPQSIAEWRRRLCSYASRGAKAVIWGGGSKGVAFLTTLDAGDRVAAAVDINPYRQGTWMAGSGHPIVGPADLVRLRPDVAIVMNPVYHAEIESELHKWGLAPELVDLAA